MRSKTVKQAFLASIPVMAGYLVLGIAFYSGYILPYGFHPGRIVAFTLVMALCAGTGNLIWATLGSLLFPLYKKYAQVINTVMALLLVWCAWKIVKT